MESLINWIGGALGGFPAWLFWPIFILIIIVAGFAVFSFTASPWPIFKKKRAYLGEKNNDKK